MRPPRDSTVLLPALAALACLALAQRWPALAPGSLWFDDVWVAALLESATLAEWWTLAPPTPLGFLVASRLARELPGGFELALQLLPVAASLALVPLLAFAAARVSGPRERRWVIPVLAAALVVLSPPIANYAVRVKQYTLDAAFVAALALLLWHWRQAPTPTRLVLLVATAWIAAMLSFTAVFAGGAALGAACLTAPRGTRRGAWLAASVWAAGIGVLTLALFQRQSNPEIASYWADHLLTQTTRSPLGFFAEHVSTTVTRAFPSEGRELAYLVPFGLWVLLRDAATRVIGLYVLALYAGALLLAALGLYPLGTVRTDIYLYPCHILCVAHLVSRARGRLRHAPVVLCAAAVVLAVALPWRKPIGYPPSRDRHLVQAAEAARRPDDPLFLERPSTYFFAAYGTSSRRLVLDRSHATHFAVVFEDPRIQDVADAWSTSPRPGLYAGLFYGGEPWQERRRQIEGAGLLITWSEEFGESRVLRLDLAP